MKRIYGIIWSFAAMLALTACTADSTETALQPQQLLIDATLGSGATTRTVTSGLQTTHIDETVAVGAFIYRHGQTAAHSIDGENYGYTNKEFTPYTDAAYTPAAADPWMLFSTEQPIFPMKGTGDQLKVDLYAYAPRQADWNILTGDKAFSVQANQTTDANYLKSDLIYASSNTGIAATGTGYSHINLAFDHKLTQVTVNLEAGDGISTSSLDGVDIKLTSVFTDGTINLADGTITATTRAASGVTVFTYGRDVDGNADNTCTGGTAIIYPHTAAQLTAGGQIQITIGTNTYKATLKTSNVTELKAGSKYTYNVRVSADGMTLSATIKPWVDASPRNGNAQLPNS